MEIIDSHTHWGPSVSMGITVTTNELLRQADASGVSRIVIFPFPSQALDDERINDAVAEESVRVGSFVPYYYIAEDFRPIPVDRGFMGGKWHWNHGVQDWSSDYHVLEDPRLPDFIARSEDIDLPIVFEEELEFTEQFVRRTHTLKIIIPHMGLLGGNPMDFLKSFRTCKNVYFDTALASRETIRHFVREIGAHRILFGSDVPFGTMRNELDKVLTLPIDDAEKELVLSGNIMRLTRLV